MESSQRVKSVSVVVKKGEEGVSIFDILKRCGVKPGEDLMAVQVLPGGKFDVTFRAVEVKERFMPSLIAEPEIDATSYANPVKVITVLHVPHEVDDNEVRFVLKRYGKVVAGRFLAYRDYPGVFNGIRQYRMEVEKDIPSSLSFGGRECWVRYEGQPRTCLKCGRPGHDAKECRVVRCFKCQKEGHVAWRCKEDPSCTICGKSGHNFRSCPVSFANRLKQTKEWVVGGGVATDVAAGATNEGEKGGESNTAGEAPKASGGVTTEVEAEEEVVIAASDGDKDSEVEVTRSIFDDEEKMDTQRSWAESEFAEDGQVLQATPDPVTEEEPFVEVRRGTKRPPSPTQRSRSRSVPRSNSGRVARAKEIANASSIATERKAWFSCVTERCHATFSKYREFVSHARDHHPNMEIGRYTCPLKVCDKTCNNPHEWVNHLASKHPDYVCQHDTSFFDAYFLRE